MNLRTQALGAALLVALTGCAAPATVPVAATSLTPTYTVMLGDSYTVGAGASGPALRWSHLVSRAMGWHEINMANGGTGYLRSISGPGAPAACGKPYCPSYAELIDEVAALAPAIVVVNGGRNEVPTVDAAWHTGVAQFFTDLREALPNAGIVATSPIWDDDPTPEVMDDMRTTVRIAVGAVGGKYVDLGQPLLGHPEYVVEDGVHPNDDGHAAIASAFIAGWQVRTRPAPSSVQFPIPRQR